MCKHKSRCNHIHMGTSTIYGMCMYMYMYMCMYMYLYRFMFVFMFMYTYTWICVSAYISIRAYMHTTRYTHTRIILSIDMQRHICTYKCTSLHTLFGGLLRAVTRPTILNLLSKPLQAELQFARYKHCTLAGELQGEGDCGGDVGVGLGGVAV